MLLCFWNFITDICFLLQANTQYLFKEDADQRSSINYDEIFEKLKEKRQACKANRANYFYLFLNMFSPYSFVDNTILIIEIWTAVIRCIKYKYYNFFVKILICLFLYAPKVKMGCIQYLIIISFIKNLRVDLKKKLFVWNVTSCYH